MGIVVIEEPGVFRAFQDYLDSLIEDEEVFSTAESTEEFRKRCNSILQKQINKGTIKGTYCSSVIETVQ